MYSPRKAVALFLTFSLLGQNFLFAAPAAPAPLKAAGNDSIYIPPFPSYSKTEISSAPLHTLADYQAQARQDVKQAPWLKRSGVTLLAAGGAAAGLLLVQHIRHQRQLKAQAAQFKTVTERLLRDMTAAEKTASRAQRELWRETADKNRLKKLTEGLKFRDKVLAAQNKSYGKAIEGLDLSLKASETELYTWRAFEPDVRGFNATAKTIAEKLMRSQTLAVEEINLLTQGMTPEMSSKFIQRLNMIEKMGKTAAPAMRRRLIEDFLTILPKTCPEQISYLTVTYLKQILKEMKGLGVLLGVAFILTAVSAQDAQAQKLAGRLNKNFNLFIDATPEQLAEMEKNEEVRAVCIQGARALHEMASLPQEDQEVLQKAFPASPRLERGRLPAYAR